MIALKIKGKWVLADIEPNPSGEIAQKLLNWYHKLERGCTNIIPTCNSPEWEKWENKEVPESEYVVCTSSDTGNKTAYLQLVKQMSIADTLHGNKEMVSGASAYKEWIVYNSNKDLIFYQWLDKNFNFIRK